MDINQLDYRSVPLGMLCASSTNAIKEIVQFKEHGILDYSTAMKYSECFYGATLVACQAYAIGTVSDFNEKRQFDGKSTIDKLTLYKEKVRTDLQYSYVELINSLANYFKHNDEWTSWPQNETTKTLRYFGIDEETEFPLHTGVHKIIGESTDLSVLCEELGHWRFYIANILDDIA